MKQLVIAGLFLALAATQADAQINAGEQKPEASLPFDMVQVTTLDLPWRIAFLPDGRMLITEKVGGMAIGHSAGSQDTRRERASRSFIKDKAACSVSFSRRTMPRITASTSPTRSRASGGSSLALATAKLKLSQDSASLEDLKVIWRDGERGEGGQFGAQIAFSPDGKYLYLTVGDRQRMTPAQDPNQPLGKILRLTLDGKPAKGNPMAGKTGAPSVPVIDPPRIPKPRRRLPS